MFRSLRFKIAIFLIITNGLSFITMSLINYEISNKRMNLQLEHQSMNDLTNTVTNLNTLLSIRLHEAEVLTETSGVRTGTLDSKLRALAANVASSRGQYAYYGIVNRTGTLSLADGRTIQVASFPAYRSALMGISSISDPVLDASGKPIVWLFVPMYEENSPSFVVKEVAAVAVPSVELFGNLITVKNKEYKDSAITLIDKETNLLHYSKDPSLILKRNYVKDDPGTLAFAQRIRNSEKGFGDVELFGRVLKMFYMKVPGYDWYAVFSVSKHEFEAPLRSTLWMNILFIGIAELVLGTILYLFTSRVILKRLKQIVTVTQQVASGDLHTPPVPLQSMDELGLLASSVNTMTENLRDLLEPFQTFIDHNKFAMIVTDANYNVTSFNTHAEEMLGYTEQEVLGKRALTDWYDSAQLQQRAKQYAELLKLPLNPDESVLFALTLNGLPPAAEWSWRSRDGRKLLVMIIPNIMRYPDGTIKGYVLLARDISDIKLTVETNTRLLEIMESAHDLIGSFDLSGRMFYVNQAGLAFLGIESLNDENDQLNMYLSITSAIRFADGLTLAQEMGFWQSELEFVRDNGEIQYASMTVVAHHTNDGGETFYSTIVRDITDQKTIERQLMQAKETADDANEAKSSFLARMSHEIRTPLNGIIGLTYLLQKSEISDIGQDYLRQISDSSHNLLHILNDVLDFSKLEADKLILEHVTFRLEESLMRLSGMFSVLLGPKPVDFIIHADPRIPAELIGDPTRLEQVLLNLGSNAIKFTNQGMIELQVTMNDHSDGMANLTFTVSDTGIGMTPEQRSKLFTPFVQADHKTSRKYGGTGLGLVISHTLVEKMGGKIEVSSTHLVGSTFTFSLRFELAKSASIDVTSNTIRCHVLVLEDHPLVAHNWRMMLESMGCDCSVAGSWDEAKELLELRRWDVAIIDMEAGDMHGEETWAEWMSQLDAYGVKVVSSTTLLGRDALQHVPDELRPDAVLIKPSTSKQIRRMLQFLTFEADRTEPQAVAAIADKSVGPVPNAAPYDILVVDDQEINRLVARQLLEQNGYRVQLASSGSEAIIAAMTKRPDVVLMDLHMPEMDGHETTLKLREQFNAAQLPIIALTADVTQEQHAKCIASGMNDIVTKPIDPDTLYASLSRWLSDKPAEPSAGDETLRVAAEESTHWEDTPELQVGLALSRLSGKKNLYAQLLEKFVAQYSDVAEQLRTSLSAQDLEHAIRLAHSLSGASGHLGATALQHAATALEQALKLGQNGDEQLGNLASSADRTIMQMSAYNRQKSY
ncbi:response regulator [Cohnella yongneupensis]|uniref:histidine kinase n=1 Tax=Cohnella yongneupensis TaxID=425006 RepID=A0ABW0QTH8_9BACL